ncbi:MAG: segregation/condensation protein A [Chloroflexi bacterium]|nr:segregation/condensation protein A [Chloroflexota bacterium]
MSQHYQIQLPVFNGPLDLLLHLIEREELDVTTIALAQVTDQYMAYLAQLEQREAKELTSFLVVAAKLLLLKSLALLPRPPTLSPETEDVGDELVRQLQAYKRFKEIASVLHKREKEGLHSYVRIAPLPRIEPQLDMGKTTLDDLLTVVQQALDAVPASPAGEVVAPVAVTITDQITFITNQLTRHRQVRFHSILSKATTRVEVIVTLLALLELIKQDRVQVRQEQMFGDIVIEPQTSVDDQPQTTIDDEPTTNPAA